MKKFIQNRFVIAVFGFVLGVYSLWYGERLLEKLHIQTRFITTTQNGSSGQDEDTNEDAMNEQDPFQRMQQMQMQMMNRLQQQQAMEETPFGGAAMGISSGLKTREDDKYVYYDIELKGMNPAKFDVKVENGQVNITGQFEKKNDDGVAAMMSSSFQRSFPAPENTDADKFQVENKGNIITVKFPKRVST